MTSICRWKDTTFENC